MKISSSDAFKKIRKPQNQISETVKKQAIIEVREWFESFDLDGYHARLLAGNMVDRAISARIDATHPTAPDVLLSDKDKQESLVFNAKKIADKLDQEDQLDKLLEKLVQEDAQEDGNSI